MRKYGINLDDYTLKLESKVAASEEEIDGFSVEDEEENIFNKTVEPSPTEFSDNIHSKVIKEVSVETKCQTEQSSLDEYGRTQADNEVQENEVALKKSLEKGKASADERVKASENEKFIYLVPVNESPKPTSQTSIIQDEDYVTLVPVSKDQFGQVPATDMAQMTSDRYETHQEPQAHCEELQQCYDDMWKLDECVPMAPENVACKEEVEEFAACKEENMSQSAYETQIYPKFSSAKKNEPEFLEFFKACLHSKHIEFHADLFEIYEKYARKVYETYKGKDGATAQEDMCKYYKEIINEWMKDGELVDSKIKTCENNRSSFYKWVFGSSRNDSYKLKRRFENEKDVFRVVFDRHFFDPRIQEMLGHRFDANEKGTRALREKHKLILEEFCDFVKIHKISAASSKKTTKAKKLTARKTEEEICDDVIKMWMG